MQRLSVTAAIKIASLLIHAEEYACSGAHPHDAAVIRALLQDAEVVTFLDSFDPALLPLKRQADGDSGR